MYNIRLMSCQVSNVKLDPWCDSRLYSNRNFDRALGIFSLQDYKVGPCKACLTVSMSERYTIYEL